MAKTRKDGPQFVRYFGPLLDALRTLGGSGAPAEVVEQVARDLKISEEVQNELMDSGTPRFPNQVAWARFYLTREGLLDKSKRESGASRTRAAMFDLPQRTPTISS